MQFPGSLPKGDTQTPDPCEKPRRREPPALGPGRKGRNPRRAKEQRHFPAPIGASRHVLDKGKDKERIGPVMIAEARFLFEYYAWESTNGSKRHICHGQVNEVIIEF